MMILTRNGRWAEAEIRIEGDNNEELWGRHFFFNKALEWTTRSEEATAEVKKIKK